MLGDAPAQALGALYQSLAQAMSLAAQNAVANQQHANDISNAVTTRCVNAVLGKSGLEKG